MNEMKVLRVGGVNSAKNVLISQIYYFKAYLRTTCYKLTWKCNYILTTKLIVYTVFPHIVAAATTLFWTYQVRKLFKFSFPFVIKT